MEKEDAYEVLGFPRGGEGVTLEAAKKRYRELCLQWHPDRNSDPEANSRFQKINNAFEAIRNGEGSNHSTAGETRGPPPPHAGFPFPFPFPFPPPGPQGGFPGGFPGFPFPPPPHGMGGQSPEGGVFTFSFSSNGGGVGGGGGRKFTSATFHTQSAANAGKPAPTWVGITISLEKAYTGVKGYVLSFNRLIIPAADPNDVAAVRYPTKETVELKFDIPRGIENDHTIVIHGAGNCSAGVFGDVKVTVRIEPHPIYTRHGRDLMAKFSLSLADAICGFQRTIPLLNGNHYTLDTESLGITILSQGKIELNHSGFPDKGPPMESLGHEQLAPQCFGKLVFLLEVQVPPMNSLKTKLNEDDRKTLRSILEKIEE